MGKRTQKWGARLVLAVLLASIWCPLSVQAIVNVTAEKTVDEKKTIKVVGNPDFYPYEYYDDETGKYCGVFPELLTTVSDVSGLDFTYVNAGHEDVRLWRAKLADIDMVSGYVLNRAEMEQYALTEGTMLLSYVGEDGQEVRVGVALCSSIKPERAQQIREAMELVTTEDILPLMGRFSGNRVVRRGVSPVWLIVLGVLLLGTAVTAIVLNLRLRRQQRKARQDVLTDKVTGLGNQLFFEEEYRKKAAFQYSAIYVVVYIGFDIREANQYCGQERADEQLRFAAGKLKELARPTDVLARVAGGEFAIAHVSTMESETESWIKYVLKELNEYAKKYKEDDYVPAFSAGIYCPQVGEWDVPLLLDNSRNSYQKAVQEGQPYDIFHHREAKEYKESLKKEKRKVHIDAGQEAQLYFQPVISTESRAIAAVEVQPRWSHPELGLLDLKQYAALLEDESAIPEQDLSRLEQICQIEAKWSREGRPMPIFSPLNRATLGSEGFAGRLKKITEEYAFDPADVTLEITTEGPAGEEDVMRGITACKELGFPVAATDLRFLSELKSYPMDLVKIDRAQLQDGDAEANELLLQKMVELCADLGMEVLYTGVESRGQYQTARTLGCKYAQGFYFYGPLPLEKMKKLLGS